MRVLLVRPEQEPEVIEIDGSLKTMQELVGGTIQAVYPFGEPVALVCNDEGKLQNLPQNRPLIHPETGERYDVVCGPFFLCAAPSDSDHFDSLSPEQIEHFRTLYHLEKPCTGCGSLFSVGHLTPFHDELFCPDCLDERTVLCSYCGERIARSENSGTDTTPLCEDCYDDHYTHCTSCGEMIRQEDAYYRSGGEDAYCYSCYTRLVPSGVNDYYYKPEPIFYGKGKRFFGVELEIDEAGESDTNADRIMDITNAGRTLAYCKHDGSLDDGFEIVTHPMTLDFHCREMPWAEVMAKAVEMGYTSHQAGTCGLHVHVNRTAFGKTEAEQDAPIARVLYFFEKFWSELLKFSRRTQSQLDQWAARYEYKEQPREILDHAKGGRHAGRYTAVNLTNSSTVEFRMFRGTLKYNTLIATLQLLDRICDIAIYMTDADLQAMSWPTFVSGCTQPELVQYLKERRLYVNEPVESEGDI